MGQEKLQILITMACEDLDCPPAEGSSILVCQFCQRDVWVSPASPYWKLALRICCTRCLKERPEQPDDIVMDLTEEQRLEIARGTGLYGDALDRLIERVKRYYRRRKDR